ncbi:uncharacterized protein TNCV_3313091 [Trichonephila clavipes]|nr:uncharacterized protein TNCV_3313091 [Trichonephila clavipes]
MSSLLRLNLDSSLKTALFHSNVVQTPPARHHSKRRRRWVGVKGGTRNMHRNPKCPLARRLRMVREVTGASFEGVICAWIVAYEAVNCTSTREYLTMWLSSRRQVFRGRLEPWSSSKCHLSDPLVPTPPHNTITAA